MKKTFVRIITIFLSVLIISLSIPIASAQEIISNDEKGIPDKALYEHLLSICDLNTDGVLQKSETVKLNEIYYNGQEFGKKVSSLKGLNNFSNLEIIYFINNDITTLEGIERLKLKNIFAYSNNLVDISAISDMASSLEILDVSYNRLSKLPDMRFFSKLKYDEWAFMHNTTDFRNNKLTYNEMYYNLPEQIANFETDSYSLLNVWSYTQTLDPIPEPEEKYITDITGVSIEGKIIPDASFVVKQVKTDNVNSLIAYDISLIRDYEKIEVNDELTVSIPCIYDDCNVFAINAEGEKENIASNYIEGSYVFKTTNLSIFSIDMIGETLIDDNTDIAVIGDFESDAKLSVIEEDRSNFEFFNIEKVYNITLENSEFEKIRITIPVEKNLFVCHISDNDERTLIETYFDGSKIIFDSLYDGKFVLYSNISGDVNGDNELNINDVTAIQKYLVDLISFSEEQLALADYNLDGKININDATAIQRYLIGI